MNWPPRKEIGWEEIGEKFTRFFLFKSRFFNVYLHKLNAPNWHPECHDHPWSFLSIILRRGYLEKAWYDGGGYMEQGWVTKKIYPGMVIWRRAEHVHNVVTNGTAWSLIITGPKRRQWGMVACED